MRKEKLEELKGYIEELKTIRIQKTNETAKFLSVEKNYFELNNGRIIPRERLLKHGTDGNAAIVLPITKENNTLLIVQPRVYTKETVSIELPAGYIEENELPIDAARRELIEETGYIPEKMKCLASYYQDQGCMSSYNHSFIAFNCSKKLEQNLDKDEYIRYFECSYDEAIELMEMGYIKDANSLITLEKSKQFMKR